MLGREGDNILNMEDAEGKTSSYEWRWLGKKGKPESLTITIVNGELNHKTFSAYEF